MRMRVTIRGEGTELRGYATMEALASLTSPPGEQPYMVIASPAEGDYDPFRTEDPITDAEWREFQAIPDQGYSHRAWVDQQIQRRLNRRELHHFEVEQENERLLLIEEIYRRAQLAADYRGEPLSEGFIHHVTRMAGRIGQAEQLLAQRDEQLAASNRTLAEYIKIVDAIRAARSNHPECTVHPGEDENMCGWKSVVLDIDRALS